MRCVFVGVKGVGGGERMGDRVEEEEPRELGGRLEKEMGSMR